MRRCSKKLMHSSLKLLLLTTTFICTLVLYFPVFTTFFSQDDFFHFTVSRTNHTLSEFIRLFGFYPFEERGIAFYRPLFREALYNLYYQFFGLNPLPFRILSFSILFINIYLTFLFFQKLIKNQSVSLFAAFFTGISASNTALLYYSAGGIQALGATTFTLLCLIFYLNFLNTSKLKHYLFSFVFFLLSLSAHELSAVTPALLAGLIFIKYNFHNALKKLLILWPYFTVLTVYIFLNIFVIGFSSAEKQYNFVFNPKTLLNSYFWYFSWALGIPEMLIDFVMPGLVLKPEIMRYWPNYYRIIFPTFFFSISSVLIIAVVTILKNRTFISKPFIFLLFYLPISLSTVIFLPAHKSPYYLSLTLPAFWALIGLIIFSFYNYLSKTHKYLSRFIVSFVIINLLLLQISSILLSRTTNWAATRGKLAGQLIRELKQTFPTLPKGSTILFLNDPNYPFIAVDWGGTSRQAAFALNNQDALRLQYDDPSLKVYYEDLNPPSDISGKNVYKIVAKLYY